MRELTSVQEKILDKALYLIGKNGSLKVSIRAIAKEANVNVSAINYYFGTKDEMLNHVKQFYIANTFSAYSILDNNEYDSEEKLILSSNEIMEYTLKYPGIITILKEAIKNKDINEIDAKIVEVTNNMNKKLDKALSNVLSGNDTIVKYNKIIFISSLLYPIINCDLENFNPSLLDNKEQRLKYISHIIDSLK